MTVPAQLIILAEAGLEVKEVHHLVPAAQEEIEALLLIIRKRNPAEYHLTVLLRHLQDRAIAEEVPAVRTEGQVLQAVLTERDNSHGKIKYFKIILIEWGYYE